MNKNTNNQCTIKFSTGQEINIIGCSQWYYADGIEMFVFENEQFDVIAYAPKNFVLCVEGQEPSKSELILESL